MQNISDKIKEKTKANEKPEIKAKIVEQEEFNYIKLKKLKIHIEVWTVVNLLHLTKYSNSESNNYESKEKAKGIVIESEVACLHIVRLFQVSSIHS